MDSELLDLIKIDDLPETYKLIKEIGIKNIIIIAKAFGGSYQYLPELDSVIKDARDRKICKEFNGYNYNELGKKYGLSSQWIRTIVKPVEKEKKNKPIDGQISLFQHTT